MACVISFTIPMHPPAFQTLHKEMGPSKSALGRLSRQATSKTAIPLVASQCMSLIGRSCNRHKRDIRGYTCGSCSHPFNPLLKQNKVLSVFLPFHHSLLLELHGLEEFREV